MIKSLEIFKYFSLFSLPIFLVITLFLIKKIPDFSFKKHTISKTALFLKDPGQMFLFRLNFVIKSLFDLCFIYYLINRFNFSVSSPLFWLLIIPSFLFGALGFFVMGTHTMIHRILIFSYGILYGISGIFLAYMTGDLFFFYTTILISIISNFLILEFFFKRKINVIVQAVSMSLMYGWMIIYVFRFL